MVFLAEKPAAAKLRAIDLDAYAPDELAAKDRELYLYLPNGAGRANLTNAVIEKQLRVPGTARNWRTVTTLAGMLAG